MTMQTDLGLEIPQYVDGESEWGVHRRNMERLDRLIALGQRVAVPTPRMHLRSDDLGEGPLTRWGAGASAAFAPPAGITPPTVMQEAGRTFVRFDGTNYMVSPTAPNVAEFFMVLRLQGHVAYGGAFGVDWTGAGGQAHFQYLAQEPAGRLVSFGAGASDVYVGLANQYQKWQLVCVRHKGNKFEVWGGRNLLTTVSSPYSAPCAPGGKGAILGARYAGNTIYHPSPIDVAEVLVFEQGLTDEQFAAQRDILLAKHGIYSSGRFVYPHFANNETALTISRSDDGSTFREFDANYAPPAPGIVRDPSITVLPNGDWLLVHTTTEANTIQVSRSTDGGKTWASVAKPSTSAVSAAQTWAPELFVDSDGSVHVLLSCQVGGVHRLYKMTPTTAGDYSAWGAPTAITGTNFPAGNMIDPYIIKSGSTYNLFYKNDDTKFICRARSTSPFTGYTVDKTGDWAGWGPNFEGFSAVRLDSSTYRAFIDNEGNGIWYSDSVDLDTWTPRKRAAFVNAAQHGSIIRV